MSSHRKLVLHLHRKSSAGVLSEGSRPFHVSHTCDRMREIGFSELSWWCVTIRRDVTSSGGKRPPELIHTALLHALWHDSASTGIFSTQPPYLICKFTIFLLALSIQCLSSIHLEITVLGFILFSHPSSQYLNGNISPWAGLVLVQRLDSSIPDPAVCMFWGCILSPKLLWVCGCMCECSL